MDLDADKRAQFEAGRASGKSVKELIADLGVPKSTAYQWNAALKDDAAENARPEGVAPPAVSTTKGGRGGGARRMTVRPITEETAGQLCAGMFFLAAAMQNEQEWLLTETERASLAGPLADSLRVMPGPIADAVNTYSAPAVFLSSLTAVVMAKGNRIAAKRRRPIGAGGAPLRSVPPQGTPPAAPPAAPIATDEPPAATPATTVSGDLREAMAAARAGLTDLDEQDAGASAFA